MKIHPDVIKANNKLLDAEDQLANHDYKVNRARETRARNHLSKMINKHHSDVDKIKIYTALMETAR